MFNLFEDVLGDDHWMITKFWVSHFCWHRDLRVKAAPDLISYNSAISACEAAGEWENSLALLEAVKMGAPWGHPTGLEQGHTGTFVGYGYKIWMYRRGVIKHDRLDNPQTSRGGFRLGRPSNSFWWIFWQTMFDDTRG